MAKHNEGKRQKVKQRKAREAARYICLSCEDPFLAYTCKLCSQKIIDCCSACHKELAHGIITPQFIRPQFGGRTDNWETDESYDGYGANAKRALEGD